MVVLAIDIQQAIMNEQLSYYSLFLTKIKKLLTAARDHHIEIIYIRHDDGPNSDLTKGKPGFEIDIECAPLPNDLIFDKTTNSPFQNVDFFNYLKKKNEKELIVCGLQTDFCINATVVCGFEHGFHVIVPAYTNATTANEYISAAQSYHYYNEHLWKDRYAHCVSLEETILLFKKEESIK